MGFCKHGDYEYCVWCDRDRLRAKIEVKEAEKAQKQVCIDNLRENLAKLEQENADLRKALELACGILKDDYDFYFINESSVDHFIKRAQQAQKERE